MPANTQANTTRKTTGTEEAKALNSLARHRMVTHLYTDILADMAVCDIEGWDKLEYLTMLKGIIDHFLEERPRDAERTV